MLENFQDINSDEKLMFISAFGDKCMETGNKFSLKYIFQCREILDEVLFKDVKKINDCDIEFLFETKYACKNYLITKNKSSGEKPDMKNILLLQSHSLGSKYMSPHNIHSLEPNDIKTLIILLFVSLVVYNLFKIFLKQYKNRKIQDNYFLLLEPLNKYYVEML